MGIKITHSSRKSVNAIRDDSTSYVDKLMKTVDDRLNADSTLDSWTWKKHDRNMCLTTVKGENVDEYDIPFADLSNNIKKDSQYILDALKDVIFESNTSIIEGSSDYYFGKDAADSYGDLICNNLSGKTISKRKDKAEEPGGLKYEADLLGIDMWDLLEALEGLCYQGKCEEIDDSTYKVTCSTNLSNSTEIIADSELYGLSGVKKYLSGKADDVDEIELNPGDAAKIAKYADKKQGKRVFYSDEYECYYIPEYVFWTDEYFYPYPAEDDYGNDLEGEPVEGCDDLSQVYSSSYLDVDCVMGEDDSKVWTVGELLDFFEEHQDDDPCMQYYEGDAYAWLNDTVRFMKRVEASESFIDENGVFGEPGANVTKEEMSNYWDNNFNDDPVLYNYDSKDAWLNDTIKNMKVYSSSSEDTDSELVSDINDDELFEIAENYNTSNPVSGNWDSETTHEQKAIADHFNISMDEAKQLMINKLGFSNEDFDYVSSSSNLEDEDDNSEYTMLRTKQVPDSDGFMTDYTLYENNITGEYVCVLGDRDTHSPEDEWFDFETESEDEANEWFDSYTGAE